MTPEQVNLVQTSWEKVVPIAHDAAGLFYNRLFQLDPQLQALFSSDIDEQGKKLMQVLTTVVRGLKQLEKLQETVWLLGRRHVVYGVKDAHFATVAEALLWTLEQGLGSEFTEEVKASWVEAYTILATVMKGGMNAQYANYSEWANS